MQILNLPFMREFRLLANMEEDERRGILDSLDEADMDWDRCEIHVSVDHFEYENPSSMANVMVGRIPTQKPSRSRPQASETDDWVVIGTYNYFIKIAPAGIKPFVRELAKIRHILPEQTSDVAVRGNLMVPVKMFTACLRRAGIETLFLKSYGQKLSLGGDYQYLGREPADSGHPLAHRNEWDLSTSFHSDLLFMFAPGIGSIDIEKLPIFTPGSQGFGTLRLNTTYQGEEYAIKIYSLHTHVVKAASANPISFPKTMAGMGTREAVLRNILRHYTAVPDRQMGGFRIEVSLRAPTLVDAIQKAWDLPFFDIEFWLNPLRHVGVTTYPSLAYLGLPGPRPPT